MVSTREKFVERFGENEAAKIEAAAVEHTEYPHTDDHGSDPFRYALLAAIGYECVTRFRKHHDITIEPEDLRTWCQENADLGSHDGDLPNYLAAVVGAYDGWM